MTAQEIADMYPVLMYVEYRAVSGVFPILKHLPPIPLSTQRVCPTPAPNAGGTRHARQGVRGWGSIFWKTPDIGLASYSIISLRCTLYRQVYRTLKVWLIYEDSPLDCTVHTV
jgi:hypothetical protein